jgi:GNAT superfamily N-acetyltransferase
MVLPMKNLVIREIATGEEIEVSKMIKRVFMEFIAPDLSQEGISEFQRYTRAERLKERLEEGSFVLLALLQHETVGMIEIREDNHISLLFVDGKHQRKGIAKRLIGTAISRCLKIDPVVRFISVNSAPKSVQFYAKLGFVPTDSERFQDGIRYVPMELEIWVYPSQNRQNSI